MTPDDIPDSIVSAARKNPMLRQCLEVFLHSHNDPAMLQIDLPQCLIAAVVILSKQVEDYVAVLGMTGIKRRSDIMLLKSNLVDETDDVRKNIGAALRKRRLDLGLTIRDVMERRRLAANPYRLSRLERGMENFNIETLLSVAKALNLELTIIANEKQKETEA